MYQAWAHPLLPSMYPTPKAVLVSLRSQHLWHNHNWNQSQAGRNVSVSNAEFQKTLTRIINLIPSQLFWWLVVISFVSDTVEKRIIPKTSLHKLSPCQSRCKYSHISDGVHDLPIYGIAQSLQRLSMDKKPTLLAKKAWKSEKSNFTKHTAAQHYFSVIMTR